LLDRFDLRVRVHRPDVEDLLSPNAGGVARATSEPSSIVAARVAAARLAARDRGVRCNAELPSWRLDKLAPLSPAGRRALERRLREGQLSARGLDRVRRVALTVADLAGRHGPLSGEDVLLALALRAPGALGVESAGGDADPLPGLELAH
jgi:magnesium chelatase family protein